MASTGGTGAWPARTSCLLKSEAVRQGAPWSETSRASVAGEDGDWADDDDYDFGEDWDGYHDDGEADVLGFIQSVKPTKKPHARHSGDHTQTHWWHRRRQKNGKEGTWKQTAEQAGYWMGLVAVALFILIGYAYHTKLSEEERKDKCAPCRAALLTVTNRDTAVMDEAEQALGLKASKD